MSSLFLRTFSQALQAFVPIAASVTWFRRRDQTLAAAVRRGTLLAVPITLIAAWAFQRSTTQALDEAVLAVLASTVAIAFARLVWRDQPPAGNRQGGRYRFAVLGAVVVAVVLIVVRQTMEIGYILGVAAFQVRSFDATLAIVAAVALAIVIVSMWIGVVGRTSDRSLERATRTFATIFLIQVLIYAFHESAEAHLLPWSEVLHTATEPYGPDGIYGMHLSELLVLLPIGAMWSARPRRVTPLAPLGLAALLVAGVGAEAIGDFGPSAAAAQDGLSLANRPRVLFRETGKGASFGKLSVAALDAPEGERVPLGLSCERVSYAGGNGICLHGEPAFFGLFVGYTALLLDNDGKARGMPIKLDGRPSRTRVSVGGRLGAITVFVVGEDYTSASFSTRTTILDLKSGAQIGELEQFTTWRNGERFSAKDFNFWGVTFARDENTFYASLRTAGSTYFVRGDVMARTLTVLGENVECPSISPDNRLIAFKKHVGPDPGAWRLAVLDLASMKDHLVAAETRYIDDQVEWLDAGHVLYAVPRRTTTISDVWVASIDDNSAPRIFLAQAESPIVVTTPIGH